MTDARRELKFQDHIIDSYKQCGGHARKWATDLQVGMPDLICSLRPHGVHLAEVKHRPEFILGRVYANPLTARQIHEAGLYTKAGGLALGYLVFGATDALGSMLKVFDPLAQLVDLGSGAWVPYQPGLKFNMHKLLEGYK